MSFTYKETRIVKGMLDRGDRQHDVASYFGVNGGRIGEVSTGKCDYPGAPPAMEGELPPPGPYVGAKTVFEIKEAIEKTVELIEEAGDGSDGCLVALEFLRDLVKKVS